MKANTKTSKAFIGYKNIALFSVLFLVTAAAAFGQKGFHEPKKNSPERSALVEAIISYDVARNNDLAGEKFAVTAIRVHANWAFASVERSNLPEAGQSTHLALLQKSGTKWKVMWSDYNDNEEVGAEAITRLRKKNKDLSKALADFAMTFFAG